MNLAIHSIETDLGPAPATGWRKIVSGSRPWIIPSVRVLCGSRQAQLRFNGAKPTPYWILLCHNIWGSVEYGPTRCGTKR
jgi:hypothetical protein